MDSIELDRYVREKLLAPLEQEDGTGYFEAVPGKKTAQKDYFQAVDDLEKACARYPEDKKKYWELQSGGGPQSPEDMILTHQEAERVESDILFLKQCGELPNDGLLERLRAYRQLNILQ
ncbi:hypothetical protein [Flintibacter muris]|uniref:hypothetical protein n=1 Tax=Flintibacter muris TaxID=2941327 RepID=UPI00203D6CF2|nr:hypothetical protein [Flintibacter muris]